MTGCQPKPTIINTFVVVALEVESLNSDRERVSRTFKITCVEYTCRRVSCNARNARETFRDVPPS